MRRLAWVAALGLVACIDFKEITPPPPPPEVPAEFHASLRFDDRTVDGGEPAGAAPGTGARVGISAVLDPGRDARGKPRPIHDDTLRISGATLAPAHADFNGVRFYEGWVPLSAPPEEGILLSITPPAVPHGARSPVLYQPIPIRLGGDTLEVEPGEDLRLPFLVPSPPGPRPLHQSWMLEIGGGRTHFSISGEGLPPSPLVVPASLVPEPSGDVLFARLYVNSRTGVGRREDDGYFIEIQCDVSFGWTVRRSGNAPQG